MSDNNDKEKHVHSYRKVKDRPGVWMCTGSRCSHYTRKEFLRGKEAMCPYCEEAYIIGKEQFQLITMRCNDCRKGKPKPYSLRKLDKALGTNFEMETND